jgi:HSP20 family protein
MMIDRPLGRRGRLTRSVDALDHTAEAIFGDKPHRTKGDDMALSTQRSAGRSESQRPSPEFSISYTEADQLASSEFDGRSDTGVWTPTADIIETDGAYVIEVELPGVDREDADVRLSGNELVVTGEVKERKREGLFRRRTRRVGEFEFRVTLPGDLREGDAEASLAYGVLRVYVPKAKIIESSRIPVTDSGAGSA